MWILWEDFERDASELERMLREGTTVAERQEQEPAADE